MDIDTLFAEGICIALCGGDFETDPSSDETVPNTSIKFVPKNPCDEMVKLLKSYSNFGEWAMWDCLNVESYLNMADTIPENPSLSPKSPKSITFSKSFSIPVVEDHVSHIDATVMTEGQMSPRGDGDLTTPGISAKVPLGEYTPNPSFSVKASPSVSPPDSTKSYTFNNKPLMKSPLSEDENENLSALDEFTERGTMPTVSSQNKMTEIIQMNNLTQSDVIGLVLQLNCVLMCDWIETRVDRVLTAATINALRLPAKSLISECFADGGNEIFKRLFGSMEYVTELCEEVASPSVSKDSSGKLSNKSSLLSVRQSVRDGIEKINNRLSSDLPSGKVHCEGDANQTKNLDTILKKYLTT
jgi:hypothetical protein